MRKMLALVLGLLLTLGLAAPAVAAAVSAVQGVVTDEHGSPLQGAEVEVYRLDGGLKTVLRTDAAGRFRLEQAVAPGEFWQLRALARGYRTAETGWIELDRQRYQSFRLTAIVGDLTVLATDKNGEPVRGYEISILGPGGALTREQVAGAGFGIQGLTAGEYKVFVGAPGYLTGSRPVTVTAGRSTAVTVELEKAGFTVTGSVRSALTGAPILGAVVKLVREDQTLVRLGYTDTSGQFRLELTEGAGGSYRLQVSAHGYKSAATAAASVSGGQELDFTGDAGIALQPLTGTITGTLQRANGNYMPKLPVALELKGFGQVAEVTANENGEFRFDEVAAAPDLLYRLVAAKDSVIATTTWAPVLPGINNQILIKARDGAYMVGGTGSVSGLVLDPAGAPVPGAEVALLARGNVIYSTSTRDDGTFLFTYVNASVGYPGVAREPYTVRVTKPGYAPATEFTAAGVEGTELLVSHDVRSVLKAVLRPAVSDLQGRITDSQGRGIAKATVWVRADGGRFEAKISTDANGWYKVSAAPAGPGFRYTVSAEAPGYLPVEGVDAGVLTAAFQSLPTLKLTSARVLVMGRVQAQDGSPVAGMTVRLLGQGKEYGRAVTDEGGNYRFTVTPPRSGGVMLLEARSETCCGPVALEVAGADLKAAAGATLSRDLTVLPQGRLTGRVIGEDGLPRAGVQVDLMAEGIGVYASVRSDQDGNYTFAGIEWTGPFWVRAGQGETRTLSLPGQPGVVPMVRIAPGRAAVQDLLVQ